MPLKSFSRGATIVAALFASACGKDSTPPLVATTALMSVASISLDAIGATQVVTVTVNDQNGAPMTSVPVTWAAQVPTVANVTGAASATVTATGNGSGTVTVTVGAIVKTIPVTVAQVAVAPVKIAGDAQSGTVGAALGTQLRVRVEDRLGATMVGSSVTFAAAAGSGSVAPTTALVGADGTATTTWTLGTVPGAQSVTATPVGSAAVSTFTATAVVGPPASIAINAGNNQTAVAGAAVATAPSVRVADAFNNPVPGVTVVFAAGSGGGTVAGGTATTNAAGIATAGTWTLGTTVGLKTVTATVAGLPAVVFSAVATAGPAAAMIVSAGNGQTAPVATTLPIAPSVRVNDVNGNAVAGVAVTFAVASGGGSATGTSATTNTGGTATVESWTLGAAAGTNSLTATAAGTGIAGNPVTFTATGTASGGGGGGQVGNLRIELRFLTTGTPTQVAAFTAAAARWQNIITAKLSDVNLTVGAGSCGAGSPPIAETIDDLVIFVTFATIDGPGGVLGSAGPCFVRSVGGLPLLGQMQFDVADLATMETNGTLNNVILHEMGHVLGIGTVWDFAPFFTLITNPSLPASPGVDTHFTGANATVGFDAIGGTTYTGGAKVPVENAQGGSGTRDSHWRESVLRNELMTGFISAVGTSPLSVLTVRSLADLGYTVNVALADAFFLVMTSAALQAEQGPTIELKNDVIRDPIRVVDQRGALLRVIRPPER